MANGSYCFYHNRFGDKAEKCEGTCSFKGDKGKKGNAKGSAGKGRGQNCS